MTFLEIQKKIVQSKKARKGVKNRIDYFGENFAEEKFYKDVYRKALNGANQIVKHCFENGITSFKVVFEKEKKQDLEYKEKYLKLIDEAGEYERAWKETLKINSALTSENIELLKQVSQLKEELERTKRGGRKEDKEKEGLILTYKSNSPAATVREIANALKVSKTTVQKVLVKYNLNGRKK